jgi:hypothetical protein
MFSQPDPLPRSQQQPSVVDRQHQRDPQQRGFDVRRHIIRPLVIMVIRGVIRDGFQKMPLHVRPDGGIAIFIERERSRRVLKQQMQQTRFDARQVADLPDDFVRHQVKSAWFCA